MNDSPLQAVILAGGKGTRLWPLTKDVPKPMVPIAGRPYLEHQLRYLREQCIGHALLLTGYLGEQIEAYFGDGSSLGMQIGYSREPCPLGTGGALRRARDLLHDDFLVIYGDSFLPIHYENVIQELRQTKASAVITVYDNGTDTDVKNNVALAEDGRVTRYDKTHDDARLAFVEAGVLALRRGVIDAIPAETTVSLEEEIYPQLIERGELRGWVTRQRFYDIGTPDRLQVIEKFFHHDHHQNPFSN